jgi:hypothetical protein
MIPFTRHAWKKLEVKGRQVEEDEVKAASKLTTPKSLASSTPSSAVVVALASDTTLPTPGGLLLTTPPLDPSMPPPPPLLIPQIARDYMESCAPAASGILNMETIVMQNVRLVEAAKIFRGMDEVGHRGGRQRDQLDEEDIKQRYI